MSPLDCHQAITLIQRMSLQVSQWIFFYLPRKNCAENIGGQGPPEQLKFSAFLTIVDLKNNALNNLFLNTSSSAQFFHSDNAANLIKNEKVQKFLFERGVKKLHLSLVNHSKSGSRVEMANKLLKYTMRRLKLIFTHLNWQQILPIAVSVCN